MEPAQPYLVATLSVVTHLNPANLWTFHWIAGLVHCSNAKPSLRFVTVASRFRIEILLTDAGSMPIGRHKRAASDA